MLCCSKSSSEQLVWVLANCSCPYAFLGPLTHPHPAGYADWHPEICANLSADGLCDPSLELTLESLPIAAACPLSCGTCECVGDEHGTTARVASGFSFFCDFQGPRSFRDDMGMTGF